MAMLIDSRNSRIPPILSVFSPGQITYEDVFGNPPSPDIIQPVPLSGKFHFPLQAEEFSKRILRKSLIDIRHIDPTPNRVKSSIHIIIQLIQFNLRLNVIQQDLAVSD